MKNKNFILLVVNLVIIVLSFVAIILSYQFLPPSVPLFYSLPWGEKQLVAKFFLFILPIVSLAFLAVNLSFQKIIKLINKDEIEKLNIFFKESLLFTSLAVSLINFITLLKIMRLFI